MKRKEGGTMKRGITIFLALVLLAALCACGQGSADSPTPSAAPASGSPSAPSASVQSSAAPEPGGSPTPDAVPTSSASPAAASAPSAYAPVLLGNAEFYSTDLKKNLNMGQLVQVVTTDSSVTISVPKFAVLDLDNDGAPEVVLWINTGGPDSGDCFGFEILKIQDGAVCGYTLWYRAFEELKADGTFSFSSGAADSGFGTIAFSKDGYTVSAVAYSQSGTDSGGDTVVSYYVNQQSAAQAAFAAAIDGQNSKPDANWVDFTADNIEAMFST